MRQGSAPRRLSIGASSLGEPFDPACQDVGGACERVDTLAGRLDGRDETDDFLTPVAWQTSADDLAFQHTEGGEQDRRVVAHHHGSWSRACPRCSGTPGWVRGAKVHRLGHRSCRSEGHGLRRRPQGALDPGIHLCWYLPEIVADPLRCSPLKQGHRSPPGLAANDPSHNRAIDDLLRRPLARARPRPCVAHGDGLAVRLSRERYRLSPLRHVRGSRRD